MHPLHLIGDAERTIVTLAGQWREGVMPEAGGVMAQSAATIASIRIVIHAWALLEEARRPKKER